MEKEFVDYSIALALKELGFDEPCLGLFSIIEHDDIEIGDFYFGPSYATRATEGRSILAPTFSQAFRWFREKYHIHGEPFYKGGLTKQTSWYDYKIYSTIDWIDNNPKEQWKIYEEAELECLKKLISIVKEKQ
jgi:hypothetical protein